MCVIRDTDSGQQTQAFFVVVLCFVEEQSTDSYAFLSKHFVVVGPKICVGKIHKINEHLSFFHGEKFVVCSVIIQSFYCLFPSKRVD